MLLLEKLRSLKEYACLEGSGVYESVLIIALDLCGFSKLSRAGCITKNRGFLWLTVLEFKALRQHLLGLSWGTCDMSAHDSKVGGVRIHEKDQLGDRESKRVTRN